ncbi:MAG: MaoC/PaaZ C-terminal domain-containing protein [Nocardioidaceae bacterium]
MSGIVPGADLGPASFTVTRADLVRYAGASGDFNPIHWSDRVATSVGLPGVIAHGMYTMALAGRAVTGWLGADQRIESFGVRFTKPVEVPDDDEGVTVDVSGVAKERDDGGRLRVDLTVRCGEVKVLGMARATIGDSPGD